MSKYHKIALEIACSASEAAPSIACSDGGVRNAVLMSIADRLIKQRRALMKANAFDLRDAKKAGLAPAMLERLTINQKRIAEMAQGVRQVAALPDPIGSILDGRIRPNGLRIQRVRSPLGTILIIFESRPNVTIDAAALCIKSANACILRGGKEALHTNKALGRIISAALKSGGLAENAVQVISLPDRELVPALLAQNQHIDLVVPRGGKGLIKTVMEYSKIPLLKHLDGICHTYVDVSADLELAVAVTLNAKTSRPSTCNATETLLVHKDIAGKFLPVCLKKLKDAKVKLIGDAETIKLAGKIKVQPAVPADWDTEYNDLILSIAVVSDLEQAIDHINSHGSKHTDAIIAQNISAIKKFKTEVDSSSVMINTSTRFADGFEYGLGAEIGISTDKLHARGPVGLEGLTTYKWIVEGEGQLRI